MKTGVRSLMLRTLVVCAVAGALLPLRGIAMADTLVTHEYQATSGALWDTTPRLGNDGVSDLVVFATREMLADGSWSKGDIWYQRLVAGAPSGNAIQVTSGVLNNELNDVSGDFIVWTAYDSTSTLKGRIMVYQISTTLLYEIGGALVMEEPRISGPKLVWREGGANAIQVMLYDLSWLGTAREADIIAGPIPPTYNVDIGDRFVVWAEKSNPQQDIFAYDYVRGIRIQVTFTPNVIESDPSTSGAWVVWQAQDKGVAASRIVAKNIDTSEERIIADGGVWNYRPSMDADLIAWESMLNGNLDIFVYRISTRETIQVTNDGLDHYLNDVFGQSVAYADRRNGTEDIFVTSFIWNRPPVANAGLPQTVHPGTAVTLDASGSSDPEGDPITYAWNLTAPAGSGATIVGATTVNPSFVVDLPGTYTATLVVTDSYDQTSAVSTVTISTSNTPPLAAAGPDQAIIAVGSTVALDGSTSYDPDGDTITFAWEMVSKPLFSQAALANPADPKPTFTADMHGTYVIRLVVHDRWSASDPSTVIVSFANVPPVANAGPNQAVPAGSTVILDGSASHDANGDPLSFRWSMSSKPPDSQALLQEADPLHPMFVADLAGSYVVSLVVNDGFVDSAPAAMTVTATASTTAVIEEARQAISGIGALPPGVFRNPNLQNTLTNKLAAVIQIVERGEYAEALNKLENDLLPKSDGCAAKGVSDKNDWITDCAAQEDVYAWLEEMIRLIEELI